MLPPLNAIKLLEFCLTVCSATVSPGPNFLMVVKCSAHHNRASGILMALGMGTGMIFHCALALWGLDIIGTRLPFLVKTVQFAGVAFLVYMGLTSLFSKASGAPPAPSSSKGTSSLLHSFQRGLWTHLTNPFPFLFISSTLASFRSTPWMNGLYASLAVLLEFGWYALVALFFTRQRSQNLLLKYRRRIDILCGILLIGVAVKLALADTAI